MCPRKKISCLVRTGGPLLARRLSRDLQAPVPPLKSGSAAERVKSPSERSGAASGGQKIKCMSVSEAGAESEIVGTGTNR